MEVYGVATATPEVIGINETTHYNVSVHNGFSQGIEFNITDVRIYNESGFDVTPYWKITPTFVRLYVGGKEINHTIINITSPSNPLLAKPGNYTINATLTYVDPNGNIKSKVASKTITLVYLKEVRAMKIKLEMRDALSKALNNTIAVNITNVGNVEFDANVTLTVINESWQTTPAFKIIHIPLGGYNTTTFMLEVPANASLNTSYTLLARACSDLCFNTTKIFTAKDAINV